MRASLVTVCLIAADVYAAYGQPEFAESLWRRAAALDARDLKSRQKLMEFLTEQGRLDEALEIAKILCHIEPDNPRNREAYEQLRRAATK